MRLEKNMGLEKNTSTSVALGIGSHSMAGTVKSKPRSIPGPAPCFEFEIEAGSEEASQINASPARYPVAHRQSA